MRSYREFIGFEKEAAARWKKEFGNLSDVAKSTLRKNVAKSPKEIVKGIEKGNTALINKLGTDVVSHRNGRKIRKYLKDELEIENPITRYVAGKVASLSGAGSMNPGKSGKRLITGFKKGLINKDRYKLTHHGNKKAFMKKDVDLGRMSRSDKRAVQAIVLRHELDEARSMNRHGVIGGYSSHNAPDVIHRESANLALMPDKVKKAFSSVRKEHLAIKNKRFNQWYERITGSPLTVGGEAESLAGRGIKYGESPYFSKVMAKKHVQDFVSGKDAKFKR